MPIYEFRCDRCRTKFEKLCRIGEKNGVACPVCGGKASSLFSAFYARSSSSPGMSRSRSTCSVCSGGNCSTYH